MGARTSLACTIGALALAASHGAALAKSATAKLSVTATVAESCSLAANPIAFGTLAPGRDADASGALIVTCTSGTSWTVSADGAAGSGGERRMTGTGGELAYALYVDSARTRPWGTGGSGSATMNDQGTGRAQYVPVYARIAGDRSRAGPGSYADIVTVTISY
jgi:spore coat protein U-like protein